MEDRSTKFPKATKPKKNANHAHWRGRQGGTGGSEIVFKAHGLLQPKYNI